MPLALMLNPKAATSEDEQSRVPALRSGPRMRSRQVNRCTTIASTTHHVLRNILHACGIHVRGSYRGSRARVHHRHLTGATRSPEPTVRLHLAPASNPSITLPASTQANTYIVRADLRGDEHVHRRRAHPCECAAMQTYCITGARVSPVREPLVHSHSHGPGRATAIPLAAGPSRLRRHNRRNRGDPGNGAVVPGPW